MTIDGSTRSDLLLRTIQLRDVIAQNPEVERLIEDMQASLERAYTFGFDLQRKASDPLINLLGKYLIAEVYDDPDRRMDVQAEIEALKDARRV